MSANEVKAIIESALQEHGLINKKPADRKPEKKKTSFCMLVWLITTALCALTWAAAIIAPFLDMYFPLELVISAIALFGTVSVTCCCVSGYENKAKIEKGGPV